MLACCRPLRLALALAGVSLTCCAQDAAPPFSLLLTAKQDTFPAGSETKIKVLLTNTSGRALSLFGDGDLAAEREGYLIELLDSHTRRPRTSRYYWSLGQHGGGRVPKGSEQDYSGLLEMPGTGRYGYVILKPGGNTTWESWFDLSKLYAPLEPGKYTVQVRRIYGESKAEAKSNVLTLTVTK